VALLLTRRSLSTLLKRFLKLGHSFGHLRESIPSDSLCFRSGLEWAFLTPLRLECTVFLVLGTLASIVSTSRAPMFLAQVAVFLNASLLWNLVGRGISILALPVLVPLFPLGGLLGTLGLVLSFSMFSRTARSQRVSCGTVFWFRSY
jgi:hypothetical protein